MKQLLSRPPIHNTIITTPSPFLALMDAFTNADTDAFCNTCDKLIIIWSSSRSACCQKCIDNNLMVIRPTKVTGIDYDYDFNGSVIDSHHDDWACNGFNGSVIVKLTTGDAKYARSL